MKLLYIVVIILLSACNQTQPSLKKEVGQMIMIGFRGKEYSDTQRIRKIIREQAVGGVILFNKDALINAKPRNLESPSQISALTTMLQQTSDIPLLIGIDQEGGVIARLNESNGFAQTLSHKELALKGNIEFTENHAGKIAIMLNNVGVNLNFAPVVDLEINEESPVIAKLKRSFSQSGKIVSNQARAYITPHTKNGVITVLKHFPGHGSPVDDSHSGSVDVSKSWDKKELIPYIKLIGSSDVVAIMTAHVYNSNIDSKYPATLSYNTLTKLLREELKFKGVLFSDDISMEAIAENYELKDSVVLAINAGVDIILFNNNDVFDPKAAERILDIILGAVANKEISEERIHESYRRIMKLKKSFLSTL